MMLALLGVPGSSDSAEREVVISSKNTDTQFVADFTLWYVNCKGGLENYRCATYIFTTVRRACDLFTVVSGASLTTARSRWPLGIVPVPPPGVGAIQDSSLTRDRREHVRGPLWRVRIPSAAEQIRKRTLCTVVVSLRADVLPRCSLLAE